ncbi:MAG: hypothetical protein AVDCRST_MAG78-1020 [uncultured Rubrobacteraceae bacterium]|uniref:Uncharacterized protein n=1 Tax=uncultured Rubrobacteraceae bacterium TaxID=349277 RepID=A0A6J4PWB5_9ACTN|nr:MAG: hypothetical protein AVDCRST_MAG78-1020 [uncultured Rubrobacteraceae bacterium]
MSEEKQSFWDRIFFGNHGGTERERKVREYITHRVGDGAHLRDVLQDEYVRRNASPQEVERMLQNPDLIEAAHEQLRDDFSSGRLDPKAPPSSAQ